MLATLYNHYNAHGALEPKPKIAHQEQKKVQAKSGLEKAIKRREMKALRSLGFSCGVSYGLLANPAKGEEHPSLVKWFHVTNIDAPVLWV